MKQKYHYKQTHKQNFTLTTQSKKALEILKMNYSEIVHLLVKSAQSNPFVEFQFNSNMDFDIFDTLGTSKTLKDDLYYQLHTFGHSYDDRVCTFIIESLDLHGFLTYSEQEYCDFLHIKPIQFKRNLSVIQLFEPCGVAASNLIECIELQCLRKNNMLGAYLISHHAQDIIDKNYDKIAHAMQISNATVLDGISSLRLCNPNPCDAYEAIFTQLLLPEVEISLHEHELLIQPINLGTFSLNERYLHIIEQNEELKLYFQEANILFDSIHKRNVTLLLIVNELVQIQKPYFLYHDELNPCTLKNIAQKLGMSESTVSRACSEKLYRFRGECFPFKHLFVSSNIHGESSDRIRKAVFQLIKQEDKINPLSDQQIVIKLSSMDIMTTRRTITKYREQLGLPSSLKRKNKD